MSEQSAFDQKEIFHTTLKKHGLLEELNLPPKAIKFIRENMRMIQLGLVCLVVGILTWSYIDSYTAKQNDQAATLLAQAMQSSDEIEKNALLQQVVGDYSSTGSAVWGKIEQGHLAYGSGNFDEAINIYLGAQGDLSSDSPLQPLLQLNLAQAYETKGSGNEALAAYARLAEMKGFAGEAYMGQARLYEKQGALEQAKGMYNKVLALENESPQVKEVVRSKLAHL